MNNGGSLCVVFGDSNLPLLHGLQEGGLNLGGSPVYLIRKDDIGENRPRLKNKALSGGLSQVHL